MNHRGSRVGRVCVQVGLMELNRKTNGSWIPSVLTSVSRKHRSYVNSRFGSLGNYSRTQFSYLGSVEKGSIATGNSLHSHAVVQAVREFGGLRTACMWGIRKS